MRCTFGKTSVLLAAALFVLMGVALASSNEMGPAPASAMVTAEMSAADASAADAPQKPAAAPAAKAEVKKPAPLFEYGFEERVRTEGWNNLFNFIDTTPNRAAQYDERLQVRFRSKAWFKLPSKNVDFYVRIGNEWRQFITPDDRTCIGSPCVIPKVGKDLTYQLDFDEVFFDNLYLHFKNLGTPGLSLKVGRMDFSKGDGLLFSDPSGVDGSRSAYYNMFDFAYKFRKGKSNLELIGILNPAEDRMLPTLAHSAPASTLISATRRMKIMDEATNQAIGLYYTDKTSKKTDIEVYDFLFKQTHNIRAASAFNFFPDRHFNTIGGRVVRRVNPAWTVVGEFAGEFGAQRANAARSKPAQDIRAWGGQGYVKKTFKSKYTPYVRAGWFALSGDDPSTTGTYEGFDPMFNRTVTFGEATYYNLLSEYGLGYWTNMQSPFVEVGAKPHKKLGLKFVYWHKAAFQSMRSLGGPAGTFGTGTTRGDNIWLRVDVPVYKNFATHLSYEKQLPGDFYTGKNGAYFFRLEALYSFKGSFLGTGHKK